MKILGWIIMIPVVLFVLLIVARVAFCGPNSSDVKVMKPMAEAIISYIEKNDIPKNIEDIPDLPYKIKCKTETRYLVYSEEDSEYRETNNIAEATDIDIHQKCTFKEEGFYINTHVTHDLKKFDKPGDIDIYIGNSKSKTWGRLSFEYDGKRTKFAYKKIKFGSSKTSGICNPMKQ
jgi:hypothetical protein